MRRINSSLKPFSSPSKIILPKISFHRLDCKTATLCDFLSAPISLATFIRLLRLSNKLASMTSICVRMVLSLFLYSASSSVSLRILRSDIICTRVSGVICCAASLHALSGSQWDSTINPSKFKSSAVWQMSCNISRRPAMCEGSQIRGRSGNLFCNSTAICHSGLFRYFVFS